jgi:hypothetical protein
LQEKIRELLNGVWHGVSNYQENQNTHSVVLSSLIMVFIPFLALLSISLFLLSTLKPSTSPPDFFHMKT